MTKKISGMLIGENPEEQRLHEKRRFEARQEKIDHEISAKRQELEEMGNKPGQQKLF